MTSRTEGRHSTKAVRPGAGILAAIALVGLAVLLMFGSPARAAGPSAATDCGTYPYCTTSTTNGTTTSTTAGVTVTVVLTVHYSSGIVKWQACGFPSAAAGATVQLYINGVPQTLPGGNAPVQADGCTSDPALALCLAPATYTAAAVANPYGDASADLTVASSGCSSPAVLAANTGASAPGASTNRSPGDGALAFTGSDITLMVLVALLLIGAGYTLVRLNRRRRHT